MNTLAFVVSIVAISCATSIVLQYLKMRTRERKHIEKKESGESQVRLDELEERIRVLERIVTENRFDLRQEIDKL